MLAVDDQHAPITRDDPSRSTTGWRPAAAAAALALGPLLFLAAEGAAATAWDGPTYSYVRNWISDLGVSVAGVFEGRAISSPLHDVLNAGLVAHGVLLLVGVALLVTVLPAGTGPAGRWRWSRSPRSPRPASPRRGSSTPPPPPRRTAPWPYRPRLAT